MKETRLSMGMPIEIEIVGEGSEAALEAAFAYLASVDERFSTYKEDSEISRFNRGELSLAAASPLLHEVFALGEKAKKETDGYFDIRRPDGNIDPSGMVKGWAILNTAKLLHDAGCEDFFINAGGDIAMNGNPPAGGAEDKEWSVGIRNPFNLLEIVKVVYPRGKGVATSGSYIRGDHIYNPLRPEEKLHDIVSITIIGPDVLAADLLATAAFAMGRQGIAFVENRPGFEGYAIDASGIATMTSCFSTFTTP